MSKYIDADKLIAEIERRMSENCELGKKAECFNHRAVEDNDILALIDSLQQEQPEETCKTCGFYENNCPFIRGKLIPYPNKVCKDYIYSAIKEQDQPVVDLEKELKNERAKLLDAFGSMNGEQCLAIRNFARHFYELGLNARKDE